VLRCALALVVAAVTAAVFPAAPAVDVAVLEVGAVAPDNVIAPVAFDVAKDPADIARERAEVVRSVEPIVVYAPAAVDSARQQLERVRRKLLAVAGGLPTSAAVAGIAAATGSEGITLSPSEATYLDQPGHAEAVTDAVARAIDRWLALGVAPSGAVDSVLGAVSVSRDGLQRSMLADSLATFPGYIARARALHPDPRSPVGDAVYRKLLAGTFHPTIVFDRAATERARQELRRAVSPWRFQVRAGEKIVGAHEVVGPEENQKMRALRDVLAKRGTGRHAVGRIAGAVLFDTLLLTVFGLTLLFFRPHVYASMRAMTLIALAFVVVIAAGALIARAADTLHPELVPVAFAAVLLSALIDARIALIAAIVLAVLIGGQSEFRGTNALYMNIIGGAAAAFTVRAVRRRNQSYYSMLAVAAAYALGALAIGLTLDHAPRAILESAGWGAVNAVASVALAMALLPSAEEFTGIDTYFKLLEWSDLNRPLLQRLMVEAPGTYAHTVAIANLAESACNAIGANGLLARVGAYYHDIGKLKKPQYFVENQPRGRNPHDKLKPATSAAIIKNHVREGVELADEYRLPKAVRAFITEHHGTNAISYFLEKAKERDAASPPNAAEYAYPGPVPQSAETAVVMLADGVEAAARVLSEPTPERIREVVDRIVAQRIDQGQLRDAPLTLRQLEVVKAQFTRVLVGMHHMRIDYPAASGGITAETAATR
jgi:putative nucleotidyltransferase with HDIG domain